MKLLLLVRPIMNDIGQQSRARVAQNNIPYIEKVNATSELNFRLRPSRSINHFDNILRNELHGYRTYIIGVDIIAHKSG